MSPLALPRDWALTGLSRQPSTPGQLRVIAGSFQEFRYWRIGCGVPLNGAVYVADPRDLLGVDGCTVVFYGSYQDRPDFPKTSATVDSLLSARRIAVRYDFDVPEVINA